jgi:S-adenosylmethionine synthetase
MIRLSEMVLSGHPDKFCDQVADTVIAAASRVEAEAYGQVEVAAWSNEVWLNGGIATSRPVSLDLEAIVQEVASRVGYRSPDGRTSRRYLVHDAVCREVADPRQWTRKVNDQAICVGWAGYDALTSFLPPEHFAAHAFRIAIEKALRGGALDGEGPDGKLLVRVREEGDSWRIEHLLVTLQQRENTEFLLLNVALEGVLAGAYDRLQGADPRWRNTWDETEVLINPNGPLVHGGSDGDNGQTGRKLVMDFYGPRIAIGGGALSGKHMTHIDRVGSYAAREAALHAVMTGATECRVVLAYAPNEPRPLEVIYEMEGRGERQGAAFFDHGELSARYVGVRVEPGMAVGGHFLMTEQSGSYWTALKAWTVADSAHRF